MNSLRFFILLLVVTACAKREQSGQEALPALVNSHLKKYMLKEFPVDSVRLADSLYLSTLQATLYRLRYTQGFDRPVYTIIRDHSTDSLYQLILPAWPGELDPPCDAQTMALVKGEKPPNKFLDGLEKFINHRAQFQKSPVTALTLDSVFLFWWPDMKSKITDVSVAGDFLNSTLKDKEAYPGMSKKWVDTMTALLQEKYKKENVLMYPAMGIFYVELVETNNPRAPEKFKLIAFRIGFSSCPD